MYTLEHYTSSQTDTLRLFSACHTDSVLISPYSANHRACTRRPHIATCSEGVQMGSPVNTRGFVEELRKHKTNNELNVHI